ncbi:MotA/TolQ/ExbB proton channel family protein [bacterium]|nr:MotA/TolQ/ExbB proton channel family protein [bacterium]
MWQEIVNVYRDFDTFGKIDMLVLALLSIYCWCFFVFKCVCFGKLEEANAVLAKRLRDFRAQFTRDFVQMYRDLPSSTETPVYRLYRAAMEFLFAEGPATNSDIAQSGQIMDAALSREINEMESGLTFFSVTAMLAPMMGLFGTVWGLTLSFRGMVGSGNTTISTVAPGISVALITTVAGLVVAIPSAAMFYYLRGRVNAQIVLLEEFARLLTARLSRTLEREKQAENN